MIFEKRPIDCFSLWSQRISPEKNIRAYRERREAKQYVICVFAESEKILPERIRRPVPNEVERSAVSNAELSFFATSPFNLMILSDRPLSALPKFRHEIPEVRTREESGHAGMFPRSSRHLRECRGVCSFFHDSARYAVSASSLNAYFPSASLHEP